MKSEKEIKAELAAAKKDLATHMQSHRAFAAKARETVLHNQVLAIQKTERIKTLESLLTKKKS
jgi:hypothetical protein